jgi:phosphoribosylanthranilate isomerase
MKIKICGLKTLEDSLAACDAGADMLGFNFYQPSPRYISPEDCRQVVAEVKRRFPDVVCAGIFVNHTVEEITGILALCGLHLAQLSGDELVEALEALGDRAYKAIRPRSLEEALAVTGKFSTRKAPPDILLDSSHGQAYGGTGKVGNWEIASEVASRYSVLLAGGLNAQNVTRAIRQVRPWGIDVASGGESRRGEKDPHKIREFIAAARSAEKLHVEARQSERSNPC